MKIAKPLLLVSTPVGMIWGLVEGWRMAGGLVFLMAVMMAVVGAGVAGVVRVVRAEEASARAAAENARSARAAVGSKSAGAPAVCRSS
ncbi:MAG TPA: hypothetical protein VMF64_10380 [Steroidobacteraceae bacterium]|nr:hypothetical protein [Steroidobacteraceae bacterium]